MRRTPTPESFDRQKKHKTTQALTALDKCLQIPHDDRLLLRKMVKDSHPRVSAIFEQFKKDKSMAELQIKLRKLVQSAKINKRTATLQSDQSNSKEINKERNIDSSNKQSNNSNKQGNKESRQGSAARRVESLQSQGSSFQNSHKNTPQKEKKVITLDIGALREKLEEGNSHRSNAHNYYLRQRGRERGMSRNLSVGKVAPVSAVPGADDVRSNRSQANLLLNGSLERGRMQSNRDRNKNSLNSINSRDGRDTQDRRESRDYSQITIRICSKPKAHNKQDTAQQCYGMQDITNSYSSSIKHLLTSKLKQDTKPKEQQRREQQKREQQKREQQKREQRRKEAEIFQSWKKSNQGNGQSGHDNINNKQYEDKPTAVKRPAKPMHRDEPVPDCFHESQNSYIQSKEWKQNKLEKEWKCQYQPIFLRHQEEEVSTVRDKLEDRSRVQYEGRMEERPREGHFFRRIREIMESKE